MPILDPSLTMVIHPENLAMAETSRVDAFCKLECAGGVTLGEYVHIASFCHVGIGGGKVTLEDGSSMGSGAKIISGSNMIDAESCSAVVPLDQQRIERWEVTLGKNSVLFADAIAMSSLGEGAVLAANAFLPRNTPIPAYEIWGGTPARKIGVRHAEKEQTAKLDWDGFFSWYAHFHRKAPDYRPAYQVPLVETVVDDNGFVFGKVAIRNKTGKEELAAVPMEFLEVI